jgi:serine/threonine protein kinase
MNINLHVVIEVTWWSPHAFSPRKKLRLFAFSLLETGKKIRHEKNNAFLHFHSWKQGKRFVWKHTGFHVTEVPVTSLRIASVKASQCSQAELNDTMTFSLSHHFIPKRSPRQRNMVLGGRESFPDAIVTPRVSLELEEYDDIMEKDENKDIAKLSWNDFRKVSKLGEGCFSNVFLVILQSKKKKMALKYIDPHKTRSPQEFLTASTDLVMEASILSQLDHENIIKIRGVCSTRFSDSYVQDGEGFFLLMDVMLETLKDRLRRWRIDPACYEKQAGLRAKLFKTNGKLYLPSMYSRIDTVAMGIAQAMKHLHEHNIILRDLKPGNIGFNEVTGKVCLFDFGFARPLKDCSNDEICGTPNYMAPEVLQAKGYSLKSDVYSFGLVLYEICSLKTASRSKHETNRDFSDFQKMASQFSSRPSLQRIPCSYTRCLIEDCWAQDLDTRPSFAHICSALREIVLDKAAATKFPTSEKVKKVNRATSSISTATAWTDVENDSIFTAHL